MVCVSKSLDRLQIDTTRFEPRRDETRRRDVNRDETKREFRSADSLIRVCVSKSLTRLQIDANRSTRTETNRIETKLNETNYPNETYRRKQMFIKMAKVKIEGLTPYSPSKHYDVPFLDGELPEAYDIRNWREHMHVEEN